MLRQMVRANSQIVCLKLQAVSGLCLSQLPSHPLYLVLVVCFIGMMWWDSVCFRKWLATFEACTELDGGSLDAFVVAAVDAKYDRQT